MNETKGYDRRAFLKVMGLGASAAALAACGGGAGTTAVATTAAAKASIPTEELAKYDAALGFYETSLRPALLSSKLAPALLGLGEHLPVVGQHVDFPTK